MSVISVEIQGMRRDAVRAAGVRCTFRSGLHLLVVSALATLAVVLGMTLSDTSALAISTSLLASIMNAFVPTPPAAMPDEAANPLASSTGDRSDATRSDVMATALGSTDVAPPPHLGDRSGPGAPTMSVARVTAEAFAAGAGSAGSGVHSTPVSSGGSSGLAILLTLGMFLDRWLPRQVFSDYPGRVCRISSRPLIRPG
jgi:hypothetical protein